MLPAYEGPRLNEAQGRGCGADGWVGCLWWVWCQGVPVLVGYTRDEDALFRALAPSHFLTHSLDHLKQRVGTT